MKKYLQIVLVLIVGWAVSLAVQQAPQGETAYDKSEFDNVTAFLLFRRQQTEAYPRYCAAQNYKLDNLTREFNSRFEQQIAHAEKFIAQFNAEERLAIYQELNRVYSETEYETLEHLEQSYNQNRRIHETAGASFSRYDFCQWMDTHPDILFRGQAD